MKLLSTYQRGESVMAQGVPPFKYEIERSAAGMAVPADLPVIWI